MSRLLEYSERISDEMLQRAGTEVLAQMCATGRSRVDEERLDQALLPLGHMVIVVRVEQWCEEE